MSTDVSIYWRFQTGKFRHLGVNSTSIVSYQKSAVSGDGRLLPIWFALVVNLVTRRLIAEVYLLEPDEGVLKKFWARAVGDAGRPLVGEPASRVIVTREVASSHRGLIASMDASGVTAVLMNASFKGEVHAARYFEDHLRGLMHHSLFKEFRRWSGLMPRVVETYSDLISTGRDTEQWHHAFHFAYNLPEIELGVDPAESARDAYTSKLLRVTNSRVVARGHTGMEYSSKYQHTPYESLGYNWEFEFNGTRWSAPLHSYRADAHSSSELRSSPSLKSIVVPEKALPPEFISNIDVVRARENGGIGLDHAALGLSARGWGIREHYDWLVSLMRAWWSTSPGGQPTAIPPAPGARPFGGLYEHRISGLHPVLVALGFRRTHGEDRYNSYRHAPASGWQKDASGATCWFAQLGWTDPEQEAIRDLGRYAPPELTSLGRITVTWSTEDSPMAAFSTHGIDPWQSVEAAPSMGMLLAKSKDMPLLTDEFLRDLTVLRPQKEAEWVAEEALQKQRAARREAKKLARDAASMPHGATPPTSAV